MRMGDAEAAEQHFLRAVAAAKAMPSPTFSSLCNLEYAWMLVAAGKPTARDRAGRLLAHAFRLAQRAGLFGVAIRCRRLAQRAGLRAQLIEQQSA